MNLLQMSFSGAAFITAVVIIRAVAINKLPNSVLMAHYTHGGCRLWSLRKNTGACDCRGEWDGKRADPHCGVQLWSEKTGKDISELPVGDAVFRYALQCIFSHYGNRAGTGTFVV